MPWIHYVSPIIFNDILQCCSNLDSLANKNITIDASCLTNNKQYTNMNHFIYIHLQHPVTKLSDYLTILASFPSLVSISINPTERVQVLWERHRYCPPLEQLDYSYVDVWYCGPMRRKCNSISLTNTQPTLAMQNIVLCMIQRGESLKKFEFQGTFVMTLMIMKRYTCWFPVDVRNITPWAWPMHIPLCTSHTMGGPPWALYSIHHTTRFRSIWSSNRYPE